MFAIVLMLLLQMPAHSQSGQSIYAELKGELSSNRSHIGQPVTMVVLEDVKADDGSVLIPAKAKLIGRITLLRKHSKAESSAVVFITEEASWGERNANVRAQIERLELMAQSAYISADTPYLRGLGGNPWPRASANTADDPRLPPTGCGVANLADQEHPALVCKGREVILGPGARIYLTIISLETPS